MPVKQSRTDTFARLLTEWTDDDVNLRTPVSLENVEGLVTTVDQSGSISSAPVDAAWIRFGMQGLGDEQQDLCPNAFVETRGLLAFQVFVPKGTGTNVMDTLTDQIRASFQRKVFGVVRTSTQRRATAPRDVEQWWMQTIWIPYTAQEVRAAA